MACVRPPSPYRSLLWGLCLLASGCAHVDADRLGQAAKRAAEHPITWGGVASAALFAADGHHLDEKVSIWAGRRTPLFGSQSAALEASDRLRVVTDYGAKLTAVMAPVTGDDAWVWEKSKLLLLESASASLSLNATGVLKREVGRPRPNGSGDDSFPSAHASSAFNDVAFAHRHVQQFPIEARQRDLLSAGFHLMGGTTAWARVEGGVHYPSDVLFGAALGNFFAIWVYEGFIRDEAGGSAMLPAIELSTDGVVWLSVSGRF